MSPAMNHTDIIFCIVLIELQSSTNCTIKRNIKSSMASPQCSIVTVKLLQGERGFPCGESVCHTDRCQYFSNNNTHPGLVYWSGRQ